MNSPATIEAEAPPETLLVEDELAEVSYADGEPPILTEEATSELGFSSRPDRLLSALIYGSVLVVGVAAGAVLFYSLSGSRPEAPVAANPIPKTMVAKPDDAATSTSRRQLEDVAAAAEGNNESPGSEAATPGEEPRQSPPVVEPVSPAVVAKVPLTALAAAVAAERARGAPAGTAGQIVQSPQRQAAAKPVRSAECSLRGDDIATFKKCVEKFNQ